MNNILSIESGSCKNSAVIQIRFFRFITVIIGGVLDSGRHFHLGLRIFKYEISLQLHAYDGQQNTNENN